MNMWDLNGLSQKQTYLSNFFKNLATLEEDVSTWKFMTKAFRVSSDCKRDRWQEIIFGQMIFDRKIHLFDKKVVRQKKLFDKKVVRQKSCSTKKLFDKKVVRHKSCSTKKIVRQKSCCTKKFPALTFVWQKIVLQKIVQKKLFDINCSTE